MGTVLVVIGLHWFVGIIAAVWLLRYIYQSLDPFYNHPFVRYIVLLIMVDFFQAVLYLMFTYLPMEGYFYGMYHGMAIGGPWWPLRITEFIRYGGALVQIDLNLAMAINRISATSMELGAGKKYSWLDAALHMFMIALVLIVAFCVLNEEAWMESTGFGFTVKSRAAQLSFAGNFDWLVAAHVVLAVSLIIAVIYQLHYLKHYTYDDQDRVFFRIGIAVDVLRITTSLHAVLLYFSLSFSSPPWVYNTMMAILPFSIDFNTFTVPFIFIAFDRKIRRIVFSEVIGKPAAVAPITVVSNVALDDLSVASLD